MLHVVCGILPHLTESCPHALNILRLLAGLKKSQRVCSRHDNCCFFSFKHWSINRRTALEIQTARYIIEGRPVSVNSVPHAKGARQAFQATTIGPYKQSVAIQMRSQGLLLCANRWLIGIATFDFPHNLRTDPDNFVKYLQDAIADVHGIDDSRFASFWPFARFKREGAIEYRTHLQLASLPIKPRAPDIERVIKVLNL